MRTWRSRSNRRRGRQAKRIGDSHRSNCVIWLFIVANAHLTHSDSSHTNGIRFVRGSRAEGQTWRRVNFNDIETSTARNQIRKFNGKSTNERPTNKSDNVRIITGSSIRAWMDITIYVCVPCAREEGKKLNNNGTGRKSMLFGCELYEFE